MNRILALLITLVMPAQCLAQYSGGSGTNDDPFLIGTPQDFIEMSQSPDHWDDDFLMVTDVNMIAYTFATALIAPDTDSSLNGFQGTRFTGTFRGDGHTVSNLTIDTAGAGNDYLGMFGSIIAGVVSDLALGNINIAGGDNSEYLGALCGYNSGNVTNLHATGSVCAGNVSSWLGGLCGYNVGKMTDCCYIGSVTGEVRSADLGALCGYNGTGGSLRFCYASGSVSGGLGALRLGGLCGYNSHGTVTHCFSTGSVTGSDESAYLGGLCGVNSSSTITNCYSTDGVTAGNLSRYLGGLCGYNDEGIIGNCYSTGSPAAHEGSEYLGGLCGFSSGTPINNSFWDVQTSGIGDPGDNNFGAIGMTTAQMQTSTIFTDARWDFTNEYANGTHQIWQIPTEGGYPVLSVLSGYPRPTLSGDGTPDHPYLIANPIQLGAVYYYPPSACYRLTSDIDSGGTIWSTAIIPTFTGRFDGNGHAIENVTIHAPAPPNSYLGIFGVIDSGTVSNLGVKNINISGGYEASYLGGLCAYNSEGDIADCYAAGSITGQYRCRFLGGLCGYNRGGTITDCYSTALVTGGHASLNIDGFCGFSILGTIADSFWDVETSGIGSGGDDNFGATGLTTEQMQTLATFTDAGWDFVGEDTNGTEDTWRLCPDRPDYPRLACQFGSDYSCPDGVSVEDLIYLSGRWLQTDLAPYTSADRTGDGSVDLEEYGLLAEQWLKP